MAARPGSGVLPIGYREEIHHPAFLEPLIAEGHFDIGPGGRLIRHQDHPEPESVDIGERFLTIRREAYENTVPIPEDMAKVFALLRTIVTRRDLSPPEASGGVMRADDGGWRIDPKIGTESELRVSLRGCGRVLTGIDLVGSDGELRRIAFTER